MGTVIVSATVSRRFSKSSRKDSSDKLHKNKKKTVHAKDFHLTMVSFTFLPVYYTYERLLWFDLGGYQYFRLVNMIETDEDFFFLIEVF